MGVAHKAKCQPEPRAGNEGCQSMTTNRMGLERALSDVELTQIVSGCVDGVYPTTQEISMARELLAYREASKEAGKVRRFDLDMSDCDSCGQDCGADMVEDLDGEYVLWEEVIPYLYQYAEYTAPPPLAVTVPDGWTDAQCLEFLAVAFRHNRIKGDIEFDDIRLGVKMANDYRPTKSVTNEP